MLFICYPKCTTCQKARKWLEANGISYTERTSKNRILPRKNLNNGTKQADFRLKDFSTPAVFSIGIWD